MTEAVLWLHDLVGDFFFVWGGAQDNVKVHCDSQNAIYLAKN